MDNRSVPMVQNQNSIWTKLVKLKLLELRLNSPFILELRNKSETKRIEKGTKTIKTKNDSSVDTVTLISWIKPLY